MYLIINNQQKEVLTETTLRELVNNHLKSFDGIIILVNEKIIKRNDWEKTTLNENDVIEIISFVTGG